MREPGNNRSSYTKQKMEYKQMSMREKLELWKVKKEQNINSARKTVIAFGVSLSVEEKENAPKRKRDACQSKNDGKIHGLPRENSLSRRKTLGAHKKQPETTLGDTAARVTRRLTLPCQNRKGAQEERKSNVPAISTRPNVPALKRRKTVDVDLPAVCNSVKRPVSYSTIGRNGIGGSQKEISTRKRIPVETIPQSNHASMSDRGLLPGKRQPVIRQPKNGSESQHKEKIMPERRRTLTMPPRELNEKRVGSGNLHTRRTATVSAQANHTLSRTARPVAGTSLLAKPATTNVRLPVTNITTTVLSNRTSRPVHNKAVPIKPSVVTVKRPALFLSTAVSNSKSVRPLQSKILPAKSNVTNAKHPVFSQTATNRNEARISSMPHLKNIKSRIDTGLKTRKSGNIDRQTNLNPVTQKQINVKKAALCTGKRATALANRRLSGGKLKGRKSSPKTAKVRFHTPKSTNKMSMSFSTPVKPTGAVIRDRLDEWLQSKGKTPSRFQHLMCFQEENGTPVSVKGGLSVKELNSQQKQLKMEEEALNKSAVRDRMRSPQEEEESPQHDGKLHSLLTECLLLLQSGCPPDSVLRWLGEIESSLPSVKYAAKYYVLRSQIAEQQGATDAKVIDIFEEALRNNAAPPDEVSSALTEFVERMNKRKKRRVLSPVQDSSPIKQTPRKRQKLDTDNIITSSKVKYSLSRTTPFFNRLRAKADGQPTPCGIVTPVRRSTRLSSTPLPSGVTVLETVEDLSPGTKSEVLFQPNRALQSDFDSVME